MKRFTKLRNNQVFIDILWDGQLGVLLQFDSVTREFRSYTMRLGDNEINEYHNILLISTYGRSVPLDEAKSLFKHIDFSKDIIDSELVA